MSHEEINQSKREWDKGKQNIQAEVKVNGHDKTEWILKMETILKANVL